MGLGQSNGEAHAAGRAIAAVESAAVVLDDALADAQAQAGPRRLAANEWREELLGHCRCDARPGVADLDDHLLRLRTKTHVQSSSTRHGVQSIEAKIDKHGTQAGAVHVAVNGLIRMI